MMAKCFSPRSSIFLKMICMTMLPPMSTGMSRRLIMNALVRTAARYSRTAMTHTLRMMVLLGFGRGDADEDVVQARPRQFKMSNCPARQESGQHRLRLGPAREAQLLPAAKVSDLGHARQ